MLCCLSVTFHNSTAHSNRERSAAAAENSSAERAREFQVRVVFAFDPENGMFILLYIHRDSRCDVCGGFDGN